MTAGARLRPLLAGVTAGLAALMASLAPAGNAGALVPHLPQAPPLYLGLQSYLHLDDLSFLAIGDRVESQTAADPRGFNDVVHEKVLFSKAGPGVLAWMRMQQDLGEPWQISADGAKLPLRPADLGRRIAIPGYAALRYPLSLSRFQSQGSSIISTPFAYRSRMLVTATARNSNFDSIYDKLPYGAALPATSRAAITSVVALLRSAGHDIAPAHLPTRSGTVTLGAAGAPRTLATIDGRYQIRALTIRVPYAEKVKLGNSTLRIYWDGEATPSVSAPLKFLAGDGAGVYQPYRRQLVSSLLAGTSSDGKTYMSFNLYYPMPFARSARIQLIPGHAAAGLRSVRWSVSYQRFDAPRAWWGVFHANFTSTGDPVVGQDMTFLDYHGSGKLIGTVVNFGSLNGVLEGDPQIYLDDSQTPQVVAAGTEDWGFGGDYWNRGIQDTLPLAGLPSSTNNPPGADIEGAAMYRFLIADAISFNSHIVVDWEHGGVNEMTVPFEATMLWYGTRRQTAAATDDLTIGDPASASAHRYDSPGQTLSSLTAAYEYQPYQPLITGTVAQTSGSAAFTMRLNPGNVGAFLRRTFDSCAANQRANVYVDGRFAGQWFDEGASGGVGYDGNPRCWRDEDFPLPPSLTRGRTSITIKIARVGPGLSWTASRYQMYSFVN